LGGEKIDIVEWSDNTEKFITSALSPAKVEAVEINEKEKTAKVKVKEDQLSLAIGRDGQNVRLAAKLTDWKIDIEGAEKILEKETETEETKENKKEEEAEEEKLKKKKKEEKEEEAEEVEDKENKAEEATEEKKKDSK